jgi:ATP-dependent Lhr-like helicase
MNGKKLGNIEEYFISKINPGDVFVYAGQMLELVQVRGTQAIVRKTTRKSKVVPSWNGGRMPLSNQISALIREKLSNYADGDITDVEMEKLVPLLELQRERSSVPREQELLVEIFHSDEGHHYVFYPFEGRLVHEGMAMLLAYRLTQIKPASFSLGMNDYGFELLTDSDFDFSVHINQALFSTENLTTDIYASTNYTEIARRRFRDIASIAGLLFKGFPKKQQKTRHLQANSNLFYEVFADYDPDNFLLRQSLEEALAYQLEESRLRIALKRMQKQDLLMYSIDQPTPFSFPILVDSMMRGKLTNEPLEERVKRMIAQMQEG